jgi:glyoxylase-like metal-dependent hydrolase (beta-lactamase superfamily II)
VGGVRGEIARVSIYPIHAIQTGTVAVKRTHRTLWGPPVTRLLSIILDWRYTEPLPIYAWVVEHPEGILVVDTGEAAAVMEQDYFETDYEYRFAQKYGRMFKFNVTREQEIGLQLKALGINPRLDVRWVVLTHMHCDHVDGLRYFPNADIFISQAEFARTSRAFCRWPIWFRPSMLVNFNEEAYGAFTHTYPLTNAGDVLLVPTPGHTFGHQSVIVKDGETDVLIAGDAVFTEAQIQKGEVAGIVADVKMARQTLQTIQQHRAQRRTVILPSHDPHAPARLHHNFSPTTSSPPPLSCTWAR